MIPRSYLYVPGDDAAKLARATERGADALIVDLEDAVPPAAKDQARRSVTEWLATVSDPDVEIWVRVNPGEAGHRDVSAVVGRRLRGVVIAKAESAHEVEQVGAVVAAAEGAAGLPAGSVGLVPLLESAAAVLAAESIARVPGVVRLQVGEADLAADLGVTPSADESQWQAIRSQIVLVSAAVGIGAPVAPVSTNFVDLDRFEESTRALARCGFVGRACIHPAQVVVANDVFTPASDELDRAVTLIRLFDKAVAKGLGVSVGPDGRMIDEAVVRQARRLIGLARGQVRTGQQRGERAR